MAFDSNFELKFAQLVDTRLQEKVPSLYPNRVGFQLIDVNDTQDKGVGVMAFIVDGQWLYAPAFFIKGALKGLEMLYVKNKDMFVPLKDSWISFIQKGEMKLLGNGVDKKDLKLQRPDMIDLVMSPHEKISNEQNSLIDNDTVKKMFTKFAELQSDLKTELPKLGKTAFVSFVKSMENNGEFANAVFNFYTPADLRKMAEQIDLNAKSIDKKEDKKIDPEQPETELTDKADDAENLLAKAIIESMETTDTKTETTIVLPTPDEEIPSDNEAIKGVKEKTTDVPEDAKVDGSKKSMKTDELTVITSPSSAEASTLTDKEKEILMRDGIFVKDKRSDTSTVFNTEVNTGTYSNPTSTGLFEVLLADGTGIPMLIIFPNKQVKSRTYSDDKSPSYCRRSSTGLDSKICLVDLAHPDKYYSAKTRDVLCKPSARLPDDLYNKMKNLQKFTRQKYIDAKFSTCLVIDKKHNAIIIDYPYSTTTKHTGDTLKIGDSDAHIRFTGKDGRLIVDKNMVYVPEGAAFFEGDTCPYTLGDVNTFMYHMRKSANLMDLKIYSDRNGYSITSTKEQTYNLNKNAALLNLISNQGIQASLAKKMIKEATDRGGIPVSKRYFVKQADLNDLNAGDPRDNPSASSEAPREIEYDDMPAQALETAVGASNKGVKEVMDTSILASLAGTSHSLELMGTYVTDLIKAMDRLGRMLFMFYWHEEEFRDQYGNQELVELEESLREVFESTGDLVLFLKEKSVDFESLFSGERGDLSEDLGNVE